MADRSETSQDNPTEQAWSSERYFRTDELERDLYGASVRSSFLSVGARVARNVLVVGSTMILARLLTPMDFGLLAMVGTLIVFIRSFADFGLPAAVVHQPRIDHNAASELFWIGIRLTALVAVITALLAPVLAWFYNEPRLTAITIAMAVSLFVAGAGHQPLSLLRRQMRFGRLVVAELGGLFAGILVAIGGALGGIGYWALVLQALIAALVGTIAGWWLCGWRPARRTHTPPGARAGLRSMLSYSRYLTGFRILNQSSRNLDRVLVGFFEGASPLGLYEKAYNWSHFSFVEPFAAVGPVAISSLSRLQADGDRYRKFARSFMLPLFAISLPALIFLALEARDVILLLLGSQWLDAVPIFQLLCIATLFGSVNHVMRWLYLSSGDTRRLFRWGLVYSSVTIAAIAIGVHWGAVGVAGGVAAASALLAYPGVVVAVRASHVRAADILGVTWRPTVASLIAAAALWYGRPMLPWGTGELDTVPSLFASGLFFGLTYLAAWIALPGGRSALADAVAVLRRVLSATRKAEAEAGGTDDLGGVQPPGSR